MNLPPIPFGRILRLGSRGNDVHAVKRALARAGYGGLGALDRLMGPRAVQNLKRFQRAEALEPDGVYGPVTHGHLRKHFDSYSFLLYTGEQPFPAPVAIWLPEDFKPTHQTAGLDGYPAIDVFGPPGADVRSPSSGRIRRFSGHDPAQGGVPGGAYGWSLYLAADDGSDWFITHLASRAVALSQKVKRGETLGTVCDAKVAHMSSSLTHVHLGKKEAV